MVSTLSYVFISLRFGQMIRRHWRYFIPPLNFHWKSKIFHFFQSVFYIITFKLLEQNKWIGILHMCCKVVSKCIAKYNWLIFLVFFLFLMIALTDRTTFSNRQGSCIWNKEYDGFPSRQCISITFSHFIRTRNWN